MSLVFSPSAISYRLWQHYPEIVNVTSTRWGGASQNAFSNLNLSFRVGDDEAVVTKNRQKFSETAGFELNQVVAAQQVHGDQIVIVSEADAGRGALSWESGIPATDGLITTVPHLPLLIQTADCAAISFYDPHHRVIAALHTGWRGLVQGIVPKMIAKLQTTFNTDPSTLLVTLSPMIHTCCYEVDDLVQAHVLRSFGEQGRQFCKPSTRPNHYYFDLPQALLFQLTTLGINPIHIESSPACTAHPESTFFSHRRDQGQTGRMGTIIMMNH
jgi:YfiH family protein